MINLVYFEVIKSLLNQPKAFRKNINLGPVNLSTMKPPHIKSYIYFPL